MAEADECIICLQPVNASPHDYDTYSIMQTCCCLYVAHPHCIAEWVTARQSCVICHKPAAVGFRSSVLREMRAAVQSPLPEDTPLTHQDLPLNDPDPLPPRQRDNSRCCTIL